MFDYKKYFLYAPDEEVSDSPILPREFSEFPEWDDLVVVPYDGMNPLTDAPASPAEAAPSLNI